MTANAWTDDRIGRLKTLWLEGRTADFIARDLGCGISRSAVLGKVHRLGLSAGRTARASKGPARKTALPVRAVELTQSQGPVPPSPPMSPSAPTSWCGTRTILSVGRTDCRWPLGDPLQPGFSLCGCPVARGAFCLDHAKVAYRPEPDTSQSLERLARLD